MNIACLMPTYGRPSLVANGITCFLSQKHPASNRRLLILDDAGQISGEGDGWRIWSTNVRFPTLTSKYTELLGLLNRWWPEWDAITIMDDDDIYGPNWLCSHAAALAPENQSGSYVDDSGQTIHWDTFSNLLWSYPTKVASLYSKNVLAGDYPLIEDSGGRFWASVAVTRRLVEMIGGFIETAEATFDQQHLAKWQSVGGNPGRPDMCVGSDGLEYGIQYVYGWGRCRHCSGFMGHKDWYQRHVLTESEKVLNLVPARDAMTRVIYQMMWGVVD